MKPEITGYNELTAEQIEMVNTVKSLEIEVGSYWRVVIDNPIHDPRWAAIAKTTLQQGFSALVRSITQPEDTF